MSYERVCQALGCLSGLYTAQGKGLEHICMFCVFVSKASSGIDFEKRFAPDVLISVCEFDDTDQREPNVKSWRKYRLDWPRWSNFREIVLQKLRAVMTGSASSGRQHHHTAKQQRVEDSSHVL